MKNCIEFMFIMRLLEKVQNAEDELIEIFYLLIPPDDESSEITIAGLHCCDTN